MSDINLAARKREPGRSTCRSLRRQGIIPGIYYFHGEEGIPFAVEELALRPLINTSESHLVNLTFEDGVEKLCILKDMTFDPITDRPVHFDLLGVATDEVVRVEVPVSLVGRAIGQLEGGQVQHIMHEIEVECLPHNIPDHIEVDISALKMGEAIHVSDLNIENVEMISSGDVTIVSITAPRVEEESAATIAEPEVITKGKKDEA